MSKSTIKKAVKSYHPFCTPPEELVYQLIPHERHTFLVLLLSMYVSLLLLCYNTHTKMIG